MAENSSIEWTDSTWNPIVGCRKVSAGCAHCYAERMSNRLAAMAKAARQRGEAPGRLANYEHAVNGNGGWNGRVFLHHESLNDPFTWRLPRTVFVNSMSDLFHEDVPLPFIQSVFDVMNRCPQHVFQILTKRPERAASVSPELSWSRNVWMGTSVESADVAHRVHDLRQTGASTKFLSLEPLLGPIPGLSLRDINWVIVGGESGPGARPMRPEWVRQIRDRCVQRGVPFFFKQWGGLNKASAGRVLDEKTWDSMPIGAA